MLYWLIICDASNLIPAIHPPLLLFHVGTVRRRKRRRRRRRIGTPNWQIWNTCTQLLFHVGIVRRRRRRRIGTPNWQIWDSCTQLRRAIVSACPSLWLIAVAAARIVCRGLMTSISILHNHLYHTTTWSSGDILLMTFWGAVAGHKAKILIDSGASYNVVDESFVRKYDIWVQDAKQEVLCGGNASIGTIGHTTATVQAQSYKAQVQLFVMPSPKSGFKVVLGQSWLIMHAAKIDYSHEQVVVELNNASYVLSCSAHNDMGNPVLNGVPTALERRGLNVLLWHNDWDRGWNDDWL